MRDLEGVLGTGLPVWCRGAAAPPSVAGLTFVGWQQPVGCGGVAVFPDDVIVADRDGAVVVPQALLGAVVAEAAEQERMEAWIMAEVERRREAAGALPDERRDPGALRGGARAVSGPQGGRVRARPMLMVEEPRMSVAEKPARMSMRPAVDPPGAGGRRPSRRGRAGSGAG